MSKKSKKEERRLRKVINSVAETAKAAPEMTSKASEAIADEVIVIEESADEIDQSKLFSKTSKNTGDK